MRAQKLNLCLFTLAACATLFSVARCGNNIANKLDAPSANYVSTTTDYPAIALVVLPNSSGFCSGTFVAPNAILTASHCALNNGTYIIYSSFGTFTTTEHLNFGSGSVDDTNDIAVLIFSQNVASADQGQIIPVGANVAPLEHVRLVGYGCDDITTEGGGGVKRTGTNQVYQVTNYIELLTPNTADTQSKILGATNRAGSCFGDSGGPLLKSNAWGYTVTGIVHAGGISGANIVSEYTNLNQADNYNFLSQLEQQEGINVLDPCSFSQAPDSACGSEGASVQLMSFLKWIWVKVSSWLGAVRSLLRF